MRRCRRLDEGKSRKLVRSLNSISKRAVIPYEIVRYEGLKSQGWGLDGMYVLTYYFTELDEYDVGIYVPQRRFKEDEKGCCWQRASNIVHDEKRRLQRLRANFSWSTYVRPFIGIPSPPIEGLTLANNEWSAVIDLVWKVKRVQDELNDARNSD